MLKKFSKRKTREFIIGAITCVQNIIKEFFMTTTITVFVLVGILVLGPEKLLESIIG